MYLFLVENNISVVFNAVAENPVTNKKLTKTIAKQLKKSLFFTQCTRFYVKIVTRRNEYNYFGKSVCYK